VQAGIVAGEKIDAILVDVTPLSLGIESAGIESAAYTLTGRIQGDRYTPSFAATRRFPCKGVNALQRSSQVRKRST
jgi:hypothetical protein